MTLNTRVAASNRIIISGSFLFIFVALALAFGYFILDIGRYPVSAEEKYFTQRLSHLIREGQTEIPITALTNFSWDEVSIAGPYACPAFAPAGDAAGMQPDRYVNNKVRESHGYVAVSSINWIAVVFPWCGDEAYTTALFLKDKQVAAVVKIFARDFGPFGNVSGVYDTKGTIMHHDDLNIITQPKKYE